MENSLINFEETARAFDKPVSFLVVDDDLRARESLATLLQTKWPDITQAEDGEVAIENTDHRDCAQR